MLKINDFMKCFDEDFFVDVVEINKLFDSLDDQTKIQFDNFITLLNNIDIVELNEVLNTIEQNN